jgi:hypothetical protein
MPVLVGIGVVLVGLLIFGYIKATAPTAEFEGPKNVPKVIPDYVKNTMTPAQLEEMKKRGYEVSGSGVSAPPPQGGQPGAVPPGAGQVPSSPPLGGPR